MKYRHSLEKITFYNRWRYNKYVGLRIDSSDWMILGLGQRWFSPTEYEYILAFFGFEIRIWMNRASHMRGKL